MELIRDGAGQRHKTDLNSVIFRMIWTWFNVAFTSVCYPTSQRAVKRLYTKIKVWMSKILVAFLIPHSKSLRIEWFHQVK